MSYRTVEARPSENSLIKPGELVDVIEQTPLTLYDRRVFNLLLGSAWEQIEQDVEHSIEKSDLKGNHAGNERLDDTIGRLMGARVVVQLERDNQQFLRSIPLLEHIDEPIRGDGKIYYQFPKKLRKLVSNSQIFARLQKDVMLALSSKYALALYEMVQKRGNLSHQWSETFEVAKLRDLLGVPPGKLTAYKNFKANALLPAVREVNALANYGVTFHEVKKGRSVGEITLAWHKKSVEELKAAFSELKRPKIGRKARISDTVEEFSLPELPE